MSSQLHSIVAQGTASSTINVREISSHIRIELENVLDKQSETKNMRILIDRLVNKIHQLSSTNAAEYILHYIFHPFGTRAFDHGSEVRPNR